MRTIMITQEDHFYISIFLGEFLKTRKVEGFIILPNVPKGFNRLSFTWRLFEVFGLKGSFIMAFVFVYYKLLDLLSHFVHLRRYYSIKSVARRYTVPIYKAKNINGPKLLQLLKTLNPDIIVSVACPQIFKKELINLPRHALNVHASLGLKFRGIMPSFWVLAKGEARTGVTVHYIDENIDTGDIIYQKVIDVSPEETLHSLHEKVAKTGAVALLEALGKIDKGNVNRISPVNNAGYYSFPTKEAARDFRSRGRKYI